MFSRATIGEDVRILATDNFKFVFKTSGKLIFVSFIDISDESNVTHQLLDEIKDLFYQKFPQAEDEFKSGNLSRFENFKSDLKNIINKRFN